jgi:RNA polymerase sigma factor (sigma-70 family)
VELAEALAQLPFRQRAAIVLRYYGRESEREIADRLDCRPGTVGSLIHRGLAALRAELGEERS